MASRLVGSTSVLALIVTLSACGRDPPVAVERARSAQTALSPLELLGKELFFDQQLSTPPGESCASCHHPRAGWTGPNPAINRRGAVYPGAVRQRFGNRRPPSAAYATFSPVLHLDAAEGIFVGGNFWDGRATGDTLGSPTAEQALGPFLNPVEQNNASPQVVCEKVAASRYAWRFELVWGPGSLDCSEEGVAITYDRIGLAIAAYEGSAEVNQFSSKYDLAEAGLATLTAAEERGKQLFEGKGMCAACHPAPLFTDFTFDNLGIFRNPDNPFYDMDEVLVGGLVINPLGEDWIDEGLGGFLATHPDAAWRALAAENRGKHKVPTLRNVDARPGPGFVKAYLHNGALTSLEEVVHFYNTRDVLPWPAPEVAANVNQDELGNLGLTDAEEDDLVAFLRTLSDGYGVPQGQRLP
jgi:cytochrome c peroxidase